MIDIRIRKGVTGGDEFLYYIEDVKCNHLESILAKELPQIVDKINKELVNLGFAFDATCIEEVIEIPFTFHAVQIIREMIYQKASIKIEEFFQKYFPDLLNDFEKIKEMKKLAIMQQHAVSIRHIKCDTAQDVTCIINYFGPNSYYECALKIEKYMKKHFHGMIINCCRLPQEVKMIDIRLRKGAAGGDEFLHYIEDVEITDLEGVLAKELPVIVDKIDLALLKMGFKFDFDVVQEQPEVRLPFQIPPSQSQINK